MLGGEQEANIGAVADMGEGVFERQTDRTYLICDGVTELLHDPERNERSDPLAGRGNLQHTDASERVLQRRYPARNVAGQIRFRQPARGRDLPPDIALVENAGPLLRDGAQGGGLLREANDRPWFRSRHPRFRSTFGLSPITSRVCPNCESALSDIDGALQARVEAEAPEALGERGPAGNRPRHGNRLRT